MRAVVIDDNPTTLRTLGQLVAKAAAIKVECFLDPTDALKRLDAVDCDIILVDYIMPAMDGLEFLRRVRAHPRHADVAVVMVTGTSDVDLRLQAYDAGVTDFLNKPVSVVELKSRVRNLLKLRESQNLLRDRASQLYGEVKKATAQSRAQEQEIILRLSRAAEFRDPATGSHIARMSRYCRLIAESIGLSPARCDDIESAAPMHDIGKLGVPDAILLKPGALTAAEYACMKEHAEYGMRILAGSASPLIQLAAEITWGHHERWDGQGYPRGLAGEEIPLSARVAAVADVFDALVSKRHYKRAWSVFEARDHLIKERGAHFDPRCVDAFLSRWTDVLAIHDGGERIASPAAA